MNGGSSFTSTPNFDNLLIQSLMSRLQLRPPALTPTPFSNANSLEELLYSDLLLNLSESDSDDDGDNTNYSSKTHLAKEESRLEKEIIKTILSGEIEKLKPNSGQAITVGEHHICVGFREETGSDYRVWEWHGHITLFDEENGYTPEYIYGNYFERVGAVKRNMMMKKTKKNEEQAQEEVVEGEKVGNVGLKELIGSAHPGSGHVLHRNLNANSGLTRF